MRYRSGSEHGPERKAEGRDVELIRVRRSQRVTGDEGRIVEARSRRRGGRGRRRTARPQAEVPALKRSFWSWLTGLFRSAKREGARERSLGAQEGRVLAEFCRHYGIPFHDLTLLKLALTHRSYLSVTGQGPRESNERLEFLGDSVLGLITSEFLYRRHPDEHEGQLTKTKSLLVSKAILSRRALRMGLGRFVLMSHSEVESGGRQRLSILADAFESVLGAIYLDQGFEAARGFITRHLLSDSDAITTDKRHTNYKSHLQEYVQNSFRTHPVYRIRSEYGPDHSKHFMVEVMVGRRTLGEGRGHNKKEAEQAAARDALEKVERLRRTVRDEVDRDDAEHDEAPALSVAPARGRRRGRGDEASPPHAGPVRVVRRPDDEDEDDETPRARSRLEQPVRRESVEVVRLRPASEPEPPPMREDDDTAGDDDDAPGRSRRRSRRGGRSRHGGARRETGLPSEPTQRPAAVWEEEDDNGDQNRGTHARPADRVRRTSLEPELEPESASASERPVDEEFEDELLASSRPDPALSTGPPLPTPARPREVSFGRGRRRGSVASPIAAAETDESLVESRVDPFDPHVAALEVSAPVVDVAPAEPVEPAESIHEREARIEEMERALDSFGRRRAPDYGRRGRRR